MSKSWIVAALAFMLTACPIGKIPDSVDQAVAVIDKGIADIRTESGNWQSVLHQVAQDLPHDVSAIIQTDVQNLATRSVQAAGIEFKCSVDFLADRAVASLQGIKDALLHHTAPAPQAPTFCLLAPSQLDLNVPPDKWAVVTISGYDMDHADPSGRAVRFLLLDDANHETELPESRIGRSTHYSITLNLGAMARDIYQQHVNKLITRWNGERQKVNELVVISFTPQRRDVLVPHSNGPKYVPPRIGGDGDFDTHGDKPMQVTVNANLTIAGNRLQGVVCMDALEPRPDHTHAAGCDAPRTIYTADPGWRIVGFNPNGRADASALISTHQTDLAPYLIDQPAGTVLERFSVWGDHDGNEAGTWTGVAPYWRQLNVTIESSAPAWAQ
jgi:hypothetical protein